MDFQLILLLAIMLISTVQVGKKTNDKIKSLTLAARGASIEASSAIQQQKALQKTSSMILLYTHIFTRKICKRALKKLCEPVLNLKNDIQRQ